MDRQAELGIIRAAYAKQILAAAWVVDNARLEAALSATRREDFLGAGPWWILRRFGDYVTTPGCVVIRADLPPEPNPLCPSLTTVWVGAELQEREIYDLFGVKFVGHPDLRRILLADDFPGHPLRKDYQIDYGYVVVHHLRAGAEGQAETVYTPPHMRAQNGAD